MKINFIFIEKEIINGKEYAKIPMEDLEKISNTSWDEGFAEGYARGKEDEEDLRKKIFSPDKSNPYIDPSYIPPYKPYEFYYNSKPWWKDGPYYDEDMQPTCHEVKSYTYTTCDNKNGMQNNSTTNCNCSKGTYDCMGDMRDFMSDCNCGECSNDIG